MSPMPDRREEVIAIAAGIFAHKGISAASMRDLGAATGLHPGSLYHYFRSKDELVTMILGRLVTEVESRFATVAAAGGSPMETLHGLMAETLLIIEAHPHATAIYQNDRQYLRDHGLLDTIDSTSRQLRQYWLTPLQEGVRDGTVRDDIPPILIYRTIRDTLWATTHWPERAEYGVDEFIALMSGLFRTGIDRAADCQSVVAG